MNETDLKFPTSADPAPDVPKFESGLPVRIMPEGVLRFVSVAAYVIKDNVSCNNRQKAPVFIVREAAKLNEPMFYEHVEILGPSQLAVDYENALPEGRFNVAYLRTMSALRVHVSPIPVPKERRGC